MRQAISSCRLSVAAATAAANPLRRTWFRVLTGLQRSGLAAAVILLAACGDRNVQTPVMTGGSANSGEALIGFYDCGACHDIPGVRGARGVVGPPLDRWALRTFIAGALENNPENLVRWIANPQAIEPGTAMPNLGVSSPEARDIAAYLYTLD